METIEVARADGIVTVTMNRPERKNAVVTQMWHELTATFREVSASKDDRVLVLTGAGGDFCSGADLSPGAGGADESTGLDGMRLATECCLALHRVIKPTIAKVPGVAVGVGCNLALGCDLIVAGESARFSEIFVRRGLAIDGGGSWLLPRLIGLHKAKELAFFGDVISSAEAERIGIVNHVVPDDQLDKFVGEWATRLSHLPPIQLSAIKNQLNSSFLNTMDKALEDEGWAQSVNMKTDDFREAVRAFLQKDTPVFKGR
ncbi:MAG TPA: enoyl-CoA hydratase [Acidimicrobiales bacterium]|nr:enoyl-CoA hydratase [Acidimicrobiales bacterium]